MDTISLMERVIDVTGKVIDGISLDQLDYPTPCTKWTVRDIVNHITGGATMFAVCVEDGSISDQLLGELMTTDLLGDNFKSSFHKAADRATAAFTAPGVLDKIVKLPFGEMPAGIALNIAVFDVTTHAADLAKATGQTIDDLELLETALDVGRQTVSPEFRQPGVLDAEQQAASSASLLDQLLAFAGRKV